MLDKIWRRHVVATPDDGADLLYVDLHLVQEVSSPQAFEGGQADSGGGRRGKSQRDKRFVIPKGHNRTVSARIQ